jgi:hypothetical protein
MSAPAASAALARAIASSSPRPARASVRGANLGDELVARHDRLVVEVAALLREALVLDVQPGDAAPLVLAHGAGGVELVAVAGIGVGDHRNVDGRGDTSGIVGHLRHCEEAVVGIAERRRGAGAGHVDRVEAGLHDGARGDAIVGAGRDHHAAALQQLAQLPGSSHGCISVLRHVHAGYRNAVGRSITWRPLAPAPFRPHPEEHPCKSIDLHGCVSKDGGDRYLPREPHASLRSSSA